MQRNVSIRSKITPCSLTNTKADRRARDCETFQTAAHDRDADLYATTDQQASKRRRRDPTPDAERTVVPRTDVFDVAHDGDTVLSPWWVNGPVYDHTRGRSSSL